MELKVIRKYIEISEMMLNKSLGDSFARLMGLTLAA